MSIERKNLTERIATTPKELVKPTQALVQVARDWLKQGILDNKGNLLAILCNRATDAMFVIYDFHAMDDDPIIEEGLGINRFQLDVTGQAIGRPRAFDIPRVTHAVTSDTVSGLGEVTPAYVVKLAMEMRDSELTTVESYKKALAVFLAQEG